MCMHVYTDNDAIKNFLATEKISFWLEKKYYSRI